MKLFTKVIKEAFIVSICLLLGFSLTGFQVSASTTQLGILELLELALAENNQIKDAKFELEKSELNLQVSIGQVKLQIGLEGTVKRGDTPLPLGLGPNVNHWQTDLSSLATTHLPLGTQLSLFGEWEQLAIIDDPVTDYTREFSYGISFSQPLFRKLNTLPFWQGINLNKIGVQRQKVELLKVKRDVALTIIDGYLTAWEREEQLASVKRRLEWASQELARVEEALELGNATQLDFLDSNLRYRELQLELESARINFNRAVDELVRNVGLEDIEVALAPLPDLAEFATLGFSGFNPEIELAQLAVDSNQYSYAITKADHQWQSSLQGSYSKGDIWQVSFIVSLPIFDSGVARNQTQKSLLQLEQSTKYLERTSQAIARQQQQVLEDLARITQRLELAEEGLALAEQRKDIVDLRDQLGVVSFSERYSVVEQWEAAFLGVISLQKQQQLLQVQAWLFQ